MLRAPRSESGFERLRQGVRVAPLLACALLAALALGACRTRSSHAPANVEGGRPQSLRAVRTFEVRAEGELAGYLVLYESEAATRDFYYAVQNELRQELGMIDALGRAWRYRAFQREPDWIGTGTVAQGAAAVLGLEGEPVLVDIEP